MGGPIMDALRRADICWQLQSVGKIWSDLETAGCSSEKEGGSSLFKLLGTQFLNISNVYSVIYYSGQYFMFSQDLTTAAPFS